jgi:NADH:ubiquinone oxidoreductase subunit 3 (subunit A)
MRYFTSGYCKIIIFIVIVFSAIMTLPRLSPVIYPDTPAPSSTFDCDDSTLSMYRHFQRLGIGAAPIVGNLTLDGEEYMECNHVWLLVESGEKNIAYDWGEPQFDRQHYEGYTVNLDYLLYAIADDIHNENT